MTCGPRWKPRATARWKKGASAPGAGCRRSTSRVASARRRGSRPADAGGYTVGVLVMTNHGDRPVLLVDGVRVGEQITDLMPEEHTEGSCIVIVATDAPLLPHQLRRVAERGGLGLAR